VLAAVTIDVSPLRASRDFRLLFVGQGVSSAGSMITYVALPYQAYLITRSSLAVGLLIGVIGGVVVGFLYAWRAKLPKRRIAWANSRPM